MIVCYIVDMVTYPGPNEQPIAERTVWYGSLEEVLQDFEKQEKVFNQTLITHAADKLICSVTNMKLQIIQNLKHHDLHQVAIYPAFSAPNVPRLQCPTTPTQFQLSIGVSKRGEMSPQDVSNNKPLSILLPPGVRL